MACCGGRPKKGNTQTDPALVVRTSAPKISASSRSVTRGASTGELDESETDSNDEFEDAKDHFTSGLGRKTSKPWLSEEEDDDAESSDHFRRPEVFTGDGGVPAPQLDPNTKWEGPEGGFRPGTTVQTIAPCELHMMPPNSGCSDLAENWRLRIGPNYKKTGAKAPSKPSLYEFCGVEVHQSADPFDDIGSRMLLPRPNFRTNGLPEVVILNMQIPFNESPSMFGQSLHGKTANVSLVFSLKPETAASAADIATAPAAVRLWEEYTRLAPRDKRDGSGFRGRAKLLMRTDKGLPQIFAGYNGKPVLLTRSSKTVQSAEPGRYFELDANVRNWAYPARMGMCSIWEDLSTMRVHAGLVIEARKDHEMDEVILGCCKLSRLELNNSATIA